MQRNNNWLDRTTLLIGNEGVNSLQTKHVLVAGLGGVGAVAAEMICRMGVGRMTIIDADTVHSSNRNRQLCALATTEGHKKVDVMQARLLDINPALDLTVSDVFLKDETIHQILDTPYDFVVDAIDTLSPKVFFYIPYLSQGVSDSVVDGGRS